MHQPFSIVETHIT